MNLSRDEMEAAASQFERLKAAEAAMVRAWHDLAAVNKEVEVKGKSYSWDITFTLKASSNYYDKEKTVQARITIGVVQQALVNRVMHAERLVVSLGGEIDRSKQPKGGK